MTKTELEANPQNFFRQLLLEAMGRLRLEVGVWTEYYLVDLLYRKTINGLRLEEPLVLKLKSAVEASPEGRFVSYRDIGDSALMLSGFFPRHIDRKGVSVSYVVDMGISSYRIVADLSSRYDGMHEAYKDLAEGFVEFVRVLDEVRSMTQLRTGETTLELFEEWKRTKSPSSARRLWEKGLIPLEGDDQVD